MKINCLKTSLLLISCGLILHACKTTKRIEIHRTESMKKNLVLQKFPCFGQCQEYKISSYDDGILILEGKNNVEKKGVYFTQINAVQLSSLKNKAASIKWTDYKNSYFKNIPDLPFTELSYYDAEGHLVKSIKSNATLPSELENVQKELSQFIRLPNWTQILRKDEMNNPDILLSELQVDMDSLLTPEKLEMQFDSLHLKRISRISPYMNFWLFTYDQAKIEPYEILILLRRVPGIRLVLFNKKLNPRE